MTDKIAEIVLRAIQSRRDPEVYGASHALKMNTQLAEKAAREIVSCLPDLPQGGRSFAVNKLEEIRHLAEYLERHRLSDPHIGPDDCDLIVAALNTCTLSRPHHQSDNSNQEK